ncbi:hemerythrin domain-containing protein [Dactylosporangium fulvum]|uniref:Hemerythrin domain-containing protein n=1 Tax=Dactylosporangium fulvum TaxID=53359 RepID=A0ABY5W879_9ACTN|nr:hemerythrin domain-containing protein [Dactylosporangium fulvum]UWP86288.1 hemerythrin domain-containing protein [Dactylosporangium fulvum]
MTMTETENGRDVVDLLLQQHDEIKSLFRETKASQGQAKQELFNDLVRLLAVHETAEEAVVHPLARRKLDDGEQVVEQRLEEEDRAKKELADLYDMGVDHPDFDRRLENFEADVVNHATREESEELLRLRTTVDAEKLRDLTGALKAAEMVAPTRPHRMAPQSAVGNILAGPPVALFDRVADAVRDWRQKHPEEIRT